MRPRLQKHSTKREQWPSFDGKNLVILNDKDNVIQSVKAKWGLLQMWRPAASFNNALVSGLASVAVWTLSIGSALCDGRSFLSVESFRMQVLERNEWWRLWTHVLAFDSASALFCAIWLFLSPVRQLERMIGSKRLMLLVLLPSILFGPMVLASLCVVVGADLFAG